MRSILLLLTILIGMATATAQTNALRMNHPDVEKIIVIKENKRIVVKTKTGEKVKGRLMFVDEETISLKGQEILIADIVKIQRNPLFVSILVDGLLFYTAAGVLILGLALSAFTGGGAAEAIIVIVPAAALIYGGAKSPKFTKGYKTYKDWSYEMILVPDDQ